MFQNNQLVVVVVTWSTPIADDRSKPIIQYYWILREGGQNGMPVVHPTIVVVAVLVLLVDRES